jgi:anti-sigma factor ChrR (cupin superfamily)
MRSLAEIVRLRTGPCRDAASDIAQIAAGEYGDVSPAAAEHVGACLRCQAEVAAYQRVLRTMRMMGGQHMDVPAGQIAAVMAAIGAAAPQHSAATWAVRVACVGGITVATGAAGALVWASRRRIPEATF